MTETQLTKSAGVDHFRLGLLFAVGSAFTFGMSGPLAKALMDAGWTPTAAVTARMAGGALVMAIVATIVKPDWFREAVQHRKTVIAYGLIPIAGAQLCYYNAVAHLSVGVALLLEYTAPILVVGWLWATTRRRPTNMTLAGVGLAIAGIILVLDVVSGAHINATGVAWASGRRRMRGVLLHDVRQSHRRRQRAELDHPRRGRTGRRRGRGRHAGRVRRDAVDLHHERHRRRGVDDVLGGARHRARRDHHGDRLHARHHGHRPAAAEVRIARGPGRGVVRRAGGVGCCLARRSR